MSIVVCSGMFAISITLETISNINLMKKLALQGYKLKSINDIKKISLTTFIPIVNIVVSSSKFIKTNIYNPFVIVNDTVAMTEVEKESYKTNCSINSLIKLNRNELLLPDKILVYTENGEDNTIYFTTSNDKYIITSSKGIVAKMPKKKQYEMLYSNLDEIDRIINKNSSKKEVQKQNIPTLNVIKSLEQNYAKQKILVKKYK